MFKKKIYSIIFTIICASSWQAAAKAINSPLIKQDNSKPIEITADNLEVIQNENKAVFSGDVQAKQGDIDIKAEKMTVFYKANENKQQKQPTEQSAAPEQKQSGDPSKILRVEIEKNIFISTKKETASGEKGVYDVKSSQITLEGDVTLTSMKNIVKGQKLVYNVTTGATKISGGGVTKNSGKKERVRGVFVPDEK